jgi:hypothetical protein
MDKALLPSPLLHFVGRLIQFQRFPQLPEAADSRFQFLLKVGELLIELRGGFVLLDGLLTLNLSCFFTISFIFAFAFALSRSSDVALLGVLVESV